MIQKLTLVMLVCVAMISSVKSQEQPATTVTTPTKSKDLFKTWSISANLGSMLFYGDVKQYDYYPLGSKAENAVSERGFGFGLTVNKAITPTLTLQGQLLKGNLSGTRRQGNSYFQANTFSYNINAVVNLNNLLIRNAKPRKTFFYGTLGIGYVDFRSVRRTLSANSPSENDIVLQDYGYKNDDGKTKDKMTTEVVIPIGLGFKYRINNKMDAYVESTLRNVNTDKLDAKPKVGTANDKFGYTCVGFTYHIGKQDTPLEWENPLLAEDISKKEEAAKVDSNLYKKLDSLKGKVSDLDKTLADMMKKGEETDTDADGVPDNKDLEPDTKAGALVNFQGKTININPTQTVTQPATPTTPNQTGTNCGIGGVQPLISVFFAFGSAAIDENATERIAVAAKMMKADTCIKLQLDGNADKIGTKEVNDKLSEARAKAVKNVLVQKFGIDANRINITFKGNSEPLSTENKINRRVDFLLTK